MRALAEPSRRRAATGGVLAAALFVTACDPAYTVGARQALTPGVSTACATDAITKTLAPASIRAVPEAELGGLRIALGDTTAHAWRDARLTWERSRDSITAVRVSFTWLGTATSVPLAQQHALVDLASRAVEGIRAACAPGVSRNTECVAKGWGGDGVCRAGA